MKLQIDNELIIPQGCRRSYRIHEHLEKSIIRVSKKHFYAMAIGLFTVCIANAQIKKGDVLLGGNLGFSKNSSTPAGMDGNDQTFISISPSFGKVVADNLLAGFNLNYAHSRSKSGNPGNPGQAANISTQDTYGLGVFVRKYK